MHVTLPSSVLLLLLYLCLQRQHTKANDCIIYFRFLLLLLLSLSFDFGIRHCTVCSKHCKTVIVVSLFVHTTSPPHRSIRVYYFDIFFLWKLSKMLNTKMYSNFMHFTIHFLFVILRNVLCALSNWVNARSLSHKPRPSIRWFLYMAQCLEYMYTQFSLCAIYCFFYIYTHAHAHISHWYLPTIRLNALIKISCGIHFKKNWRRRTTLKCFITYKLIQNAFDISFYSIL